VAQINETYEDGTKMNGMTAPGKDKSFWGPMLEKAFAKMYGNFEHINGGSMALGVRAMIGGVHKYVNHKKPTADQIWSELLTHHATKDIVTASTAGAGDHTDRFVSGISKSHAYTVLGTQKLKEGTRLVKMRNPWGAEDYKGPSSDRDTKFWTAARLQEVGHKLNMKDGVFYMPIEQFKKDFEETHVNIDPTDMSSAYFLRLDDDGTGSSAC
jgi:hypothetical protein